MKRGKTQRTKPKRRHKYCPVCKEEVAMSVMREAEDEYDMWWLLCPSCNSKFALTHREYHREKQPDISAIKENRAKIYRTSKTYSIGELLYHPKLGDVGLVVDKAAPPLINCSGAIIVSFIEAGEKTLIEGYTTA
jgi:uncharacterized protein YbaR (Trm112 family)